MKKFRSVINEIRKLALMNPLGHNDDNVYFTKDGNPCCIFGHALERLGVRPSELGTPDDLLDCQLVTELPWERFGIECPSEYQERWILKVQTTADSGISWVVSVLTADTMPV